MSQVYIAFNEQFLHNVYDENLKTNSVQEQHLLLLSLKAFTSSIKIKGLNVETSLAC